ncbi:hypothetical protein LSAT2_018213 [Lamellibrachia satsuma]|nr:hypothetical protein LSAT2_018213 [Lamellibrachia satsuma]
MHRVTAARSRSRPATAVNQLMQRSLAASPTRAPHAITRTASAERTRPRTVRTRDVPGQLLSALQHATVLVREVNFPLSRHCTPLGSECAVTLDSSHRWQNQSETMTISTPNDICGTLHLTSSNRERPWSGRASEPRALMLYSVVSIEVA